MKKICYLLSFAVCFIGCSKVEKLPAADDIIARYVQIMGGAKRWAAIKTSEIHATGTIGSKKLNLLTIKAGNGKFYESMQGDGLSLIDIYESEKAINIQNGKQQQVTDIVMLDHFRLQSCILPDMNYIQLQYKRQVLGIENINGVPCYKISLTSKNGSVNINYYEKRSGLLLMIEKKGVKTFLTDYKPYKGCFIPFTMSTDIGKDFSMKVKVTEWLFNDSSSIQLYNTKKQQLGL